MRKPNSAGRLRADSISESVHGSPSDRSHHPSAAVTADFHHERIVVFSEGKIEALADGRPGVHRMAETGRCCALAVDSN